MNIAFRCRAVSINPGLINKEGIAADCWGIIVLPAVEEKMIDPVSDYIFCCHGGVTKLYETLCSHIVQRSGKPEISDDKVKLLLCLFLSGQDFSQQLIKRLQFGKQLRKVDFSYPAMGQFTGCFFDMIESVAILFV